MSYLDIDRILKEYTPSELFYRDYYFAKQEPVKLQDFLAHTDYEFLKKNLILIPELPFDPSYMTEDEFENEDINLVKHQRYTPPFVHQHIFFELFYVYAGHCTQEIDGMTIEHPAGDICIIAPGTSHAISVLDDSIVIDILIRQSTFNETFFELLTGHNVLADFFREILYSRQHANYLIFHTGQDEQLRAVLTSLYDENMHKDSYSRNLMNHLLIVFFIYLLQHHENHIEIPVKHADDASQIPQILIYIEDHYRDVTLKTLAEAFHFSTAYLSRLIKANTGQNFTSILRVIRLKKACQMLCETNLSIASIAEELGYTSQEHFIRTFKASFLLSPTQYRKQHPSPKTC